jgi:hypothetical protein
MNRANTKDKIGAENANAAMSPAKTRSTTASPIGTPQKKKVGKHTIRQNMTYNPRINILN